MRAPNHRPNKTGDRNLSLVFIYIARNRVNGKQIVSESCKIPVRRAVLTRANNKQLRNLYEERGPALGAGPLLAKTPPVGQRRPGLPRAYPAVQSGAFCLRGGPAAPWGPHSARKQDPPGPPMGRACGGARPISAARLRRSPALHLRPIELVVYEWPYRREISSRDGLPA